MIPDSWSFMIYLPIISVTLPLTYSGSVARNMGALAPLPSGSLDRAADACLTLRMTNFGAEQNTVFQIMSPRLYGDFDLFTLVCLVPKYV